MFSLTVLSDQEEDYLAYCSPSGVLYLARQGGGDNHRRKIASIYPVEEEEVEEEEEEEERETRRFDTLFIYFFHPSDYRTISSLLSPPPSPPAPLRPLGYLCRAVWSGWFVICVF